MNVVVEKEIGWGETRTPSCQGPNRLQRPWLSFAGPSVLMQWSMEGIEPSSRVCKTRVFPLDDSPDAARRPLGRRANDETWHARHPVERIAIGPSQRVLSARELTVETSGIEPDPPGLQPGARTNYARFP